MKRRGSNNLWISMILIAFMTLGMTGCGKNTGPVTDTQTGPDTDGEPGKAMGRYMERESDLSDIMRWPAGMTKREDGSLVVYDYENGMFRSADEGKTWEAVEQEWFMEAKSSGDLMNLTASPQNGVAVIVDPYEKKVGDENEVTPVYFYMDDDGVRTDLEISYMAGAEDYVQRFFFAPDGTLYGVAVNGSVYVINVEDGSSKVFFEAPETIKYMTFINNQIIMLGDHEILYYNKEKGDVGEGDQVLTDFIQTETSDEKYYFNDKSSLLLLPNEEENAIYLLFEKGLYKHVMGGSVVEQMIDGNLCMMSLPTIGPFSPAITPSGIQQLPNDRFLILYENRKLMEYYYDETVPTVPSTVINVYSLEDNKVMGQTVLNYRKKNPDVYINYVIGMDPESGVTKEDAVKKLNTELMAGKGPDIIIMDGLDADSYTKKGMLADISPYIEELQKTEPLLESIVDAYRQDGAIYMLPAEVYLYLLVGDPEQLAKVTDLKTLADAAESIREQYPEGNIFNCYTEEMVLRMLATHNIPAVMTEEGNVDAGKLAEFLTQAKRIYEAEAAGTPPEDLAQFVKELDLNNSYEMRYLFYLATYSQGLLTDEYRMMLGAMNDFLWSFETVVALRDYKENFDFTSAKGMVNNVFKPVSLAAVSSRSENQDIAGEILETFYSDETLKEHMRFGFPINRKTIEEEMKYAADHAGELFWTTTATDKDGNERSMDVKGTTQEDMDVIMEMLEQLKVPFACPDVIENAIYEIGPDALNGTRSVDETVAEIMKRVSIYLAE